MRYCMHPKRMLSLSFPILFMNSVYHLKSIQALPRWPSSATQKWTCSTENLRRTQNSLLSTREIRNLWFLWYWIQSTNFGAWKCYRRKAHKRYKDIFTILWRISYPETLVGFNHWVTFQKHTVNIEISRSIRLRSEQIYSEPFTVFHTFVTILIHFVRPIKVLCE